MYYRSIHYLRAYAALSVVVFHAFIEYAPQALAGGVDVFFVISGFVMVQAARKGFSAPAFLLARAIRIFPTYWIACSLAALLVASAPLRDWFLLPEARMLYQWPVPEPFLSPGWTLAYEAMFYLLFAASLGRWWLASALLAGLALLGSVWQAVITNPIILEFTFGMAIANLPRSVLARWSGLLLAMAILGFAAASQVEQLHMATRWWLLGVPSAALVAGLVGAENRLPFSRTLEFLGAASYSIYLVHLLPMLWLRHWPGVLLGVAAGCLLYAALERPTLTALRHFFQRYGPWDGQQHRSPARQSGWKPGLASGSGFTAGRGEQFGRH